MDDFNGEVSCGEVLGTKPGEQALTYGFPVAVVGTPFFSEKQAVFPCGQC